MLDFAALSACPDFAGLDFAGLALSQYEEASYIAACAAEAARLHLPAGFEGVRDQRSRLLARGYDLAVIGHVLARMAQHPAAFQALFVMLDEGERAETGPRLVIDNTAPRRPTLLQRVTALMPWVAGKGRADGRASIAEAA